VSTAATRHRLWAAAVFALTVALTVLAQPGRDLAAFAYAFAVPAIFWAFLRPPARLYAATLLAANAAAWTLILAWLHNVTLGGLLLLGPFVGAWNALWFLAVRWTMPRLPGRPAPQRLLALLALAALWVLIEWSRSWLLGGFPWLPLAATQWKQLVILQTASLAGAYGVSFILVAFNIAFAAYAHRLLLEGNRRGLSRRSQEFLLALLLLLGSFSLFLSETFGRARFDAPVGNFAVLQPAIPQSVKWDPAKVPLILDTLQSLSRQAAATNPDLLLWPESALPYPLAGNLPAARQMAAWTRALASQINRPVLTGAEAVQTAPDGSNRWFNSVALVTPDGVAAPLYAKRRLVPFGEFVPFRPLLGWLSKITDVGEGDYSPGDAPVLITTGGHAIAPLVCYEDTYPRLARDSVRAGAALLFVATNNGWFGSGDAAFQHAAHSVLRAVENRRPVLRAGNSGWSGWIDEYGAIRAVLTQTADGQIRHTPPGRDDDPGTIYFRGTQTIAVTADTRWIGRQSFYTRHGDWFVALCALLVPAGWLATKTSPPTPAPAKRLMS
jgi:apolipoprotein N-acyltransferase